ncbi:MAG: crossover junction endodeoxyribonuclease RuvC [Candidatus Brocadiae bacterium]|nr:crossover junction endodeoxyribonuclease RuvC [Candidatus Brocadiia bacterium]
MLIIGIDPGRDMGFCIIDFENNQKTLVSFGTWMDTSKGKIHYDDRILMLAARLHNLLIEKTGMIAALAYEGGFIGKNPRQAMRLEKIRGMIMGVCYMLNIFSYEIPHTEAKKNLLNKGNASKEETVEKIKAVFGLSEIDHNAADSVSVALAYIERTV